MRLPIVMEQCLAASAQLVQCRAENVAWFVRQFAAYVRSEITGLKESDMVDAAIVELALKDQPNLEAALRIGKNFDAIRRKVASKFLSCVQKGLGGVGSAAGRRLGSSGDMAWWKFMPMVRTFRTGETQQQSHGYISRRMQCVNT